MSASKNDAPDDYKLWEFLFKQDDYVVQQFVTAVVGIGALFFAYGSLTTLPYERLAIAFIGLGASLIVWMHAYGSHVQADAIREEIGDTILMKRYKSIMKWKDRNRFRRYFYHSVTRLITYFSSLVALTWALIISADVANLAGFSIPIWLIESVAISGIAFVLALATYRKVQDIKRFS
jgi:hypothetical protein